LITTPIYTLKTCLSCGRGKLIRLLCISIILVLPGYRAFSQQIPDAPLHTDSVRRFIIGDIYIYGNRVTKSYIIERELPFKKGDSTNIAELVQSFIHAKERLINTRLFNEVIISLKGFRGYYADISIEVKERWYIFPLPYVRPIDRNFTAWADKNYSLSRLDYGLRYAHYNFTGRNDNLRVWLITGYTKQLEMAYDQPYADKSLKHGFGFGVSYLSQKEMNVATINNQQVFINSDTISYAGKFLKEQFNFSLRYYWRPALRTRHYLRFTFNSISVDTAVTVYGPHYFNNNITHVNFPELWYSITYNNVDYVPYPLKGFYTESGFIKRGISSNMNLWELYVRAYEVGPRGKRFFFVSQNMGMLKLPFDQPFYNQPFLGYGDFYMRGFEKYVVDGAAGGLARNSLIKQLFRFDIPFLRGTSHDLIPVRIYAKTYFDMGYVYNQNFRDNSLVNRFLYSGGVGFDVVTFYDFVFRFEYSVNQLGEKGFNFHIRNDF
jgi:outer membrane protein assembly factor BamA